MCGALGVVVIEFENYPSWLCNSEVTRQSEGRYFFLIYPQIIETRSTTTRSSG